MDRSEEQATSPSREQATKGRGEPETTGRGTRPRETPADEDEGRDEEQEDAPDRMEHITQHIVDALRELRGGSRPGVNRAQKSLNDALELL